jgi:hypothetical protein
LEAARIPNSLEAKLLFKLLELHPVWKEIFIHFIPRSCPQKNRNLCLVRDEITYWDHLDPFRGSLIFGRWGDFWVDYCHLPESIPQLNANLEEAPRFIYL